VLKGVATVHVASDTATPIVCEPTSRPSRGVFRVTDRGSSCSGTTLIGGLPKNAIPAAAKRPYQRAH
jgi:hypothetical protein